MNYQRSYKRVRAVGEPARDGGRPEGPAIVWCRVGTCTELAFDRGLCCRHLLDAALGDAEARAAAIPL
jgi:hypothetical protein